MDANLAFKHSQLWDFIHKALLAEHISDFVLEPERPLVYMCRGSIVRTSDFITTEDFHTFGRAVYEGLNRDYETRHELIGHVDGAIAVEIYRFRVSYFPQVDGPRAVLRLLSSVIPAPADVNLPLVLQEQGLSIKQGLVLLVGSTGSGKSTTIASYIQLRASSKKEHIITLEDPIEFVFPTDLPSYFTQREILVHTPSYAQGLKAALRQAPHVIFVGEIRDSETAETAMQAAETGHLVVSTLHAGTCVQAVQRYVQLIPEERMAFALDILAESMEIVIVQTLVPIKNGTKRLAIHEILKKSPATTNCIKTKNWNGLASELEYGVERGQQTFSRSLDNAKLRGLLSEEDYKEAKKKLQRMGVIK